MELRSDQTSTGIKVGSLVKWKGRVAVLWGIGFSPKGEICMLDIVNGPNYQEAPASELELIR